MRLFGETPRRKVLILSPHTDAGELGAGGTIRKLVDNKHIIQYTVFSSPTRANLKEFQEATRVLGVPRTASIAWTCPISGYHTIGRKSLSGS